MVKKIKSFTVDEKTYNALIKLFKKYNVNVSLSAYVDGCLKELLSYLRGCESILESHEGFKEHRDMMGHMVERIVFKEGRIPEEHLETLFNMLYEWQDEVEARKDNYSVKLHSFLRADTLYKLSKDSKFLIDKKSGEKYPTFKMPDGLLSVDMRKGEVRQKK